MPTVKKKTTAKKKATNQAAEVPENPVTPEQEAAEPERAREEDGTFKADDPSTPDVNEAWKGGKGPDDSELTTGEAGTNEPPESEPEPEEDTTHVTARRAAAIARVCHEANRAWCVENGDYSQQPWDRAPRWQKQSAMAGVRMVMKNPDVTPEESHENWLENKKATGWTYGPNKDEVAKTHPCMVHYDELPEFQRTKDEMFVAIVKALT